jgi:AcrR family transcriptional regulator
MGIVERKERDKESMRSAVLEAAMDLYLEKGIESLTIRAVAERIEFSPATIYLYFRDKDDIVYQLYNIAFGTFYEKQLEWNSIADPLERLRHGCKNYVEWGVQNPKLYDLMFILDIPMDVIEEENCEDNGLRSFDELKKLLAECIAADKIKIKDPELAAMMCWNMIHGVTSLLIKKRIVIPHEAVAQMTDAILDTYFLLVAKQ